MSDRVLALEIVAPDQSVYRDEQVISLVVPAAEGYMGILPHHAPLMAELRIGEILVKRADDSLQLIATSGGFLMVENNQVTILADTAELSQSIDIQRAEEAKHRAEQRIAERAEGIDATRAQAALQRAMNRLAIAGQGGGQQD